LKYLHDEANKRDVQFNRNDWTCEEEEVPQQENGYDCGVFTIIYADLLSEDLPLNFSQKNITRFRRKIVADILRKGFDYDITDDAEDKFPGYLSESKINSPTILVGN
jgi:Ulp1 family protease